MADGSAPGRSVSHALFNNAAFGEVALSADRILAAAGAGGTVTTRQVAAATGSADSVVRPVMQRLVGAGMLTPLPKTGAPNGPQLFLRAEPARWVVLLALVVDTTAVRPVEERLRRQ